MAHDKAPGPASGAVTCAFAEPAESIAVPGRSGAVAADRIFGALLTRGAVPLRRTCHQGTAP